MVKENCTRYFLKKQQGKILFKTTAMGEKIELTLLKQKRGKLMVKYFKEEVGLND